MTAVLQSIYDAEDEYVGTLALEPAPCHLCAADSGPRRLVDVGTRLGVLRAWECLSHGPRLGQIADRRNGRRK